MTKAIQIQEELINIFSILRRKGFAITVRELLDALYIFDSCNYPHSQLEENIRMLWLSGNKDIRFEIEFREVWNSRLSVLLNENASVENLLIPETTADSFETLEIQIPETQSDEPSESQTQPEHSPSEVLEEPVEDISSDDSANPEEENLTNNSNGNRVNKKYFPNRRKKVSVTSDAPDLATPSLSSIPISFDQNSIKRDGELFTYKPISKLSMAYAWRYLRRPVLDGPADVLDVDTTIKLITNQGFFLKPIYRRRVSNHAHVILLIDEGGSMVPFRYVIQDLVETALYESSIKLIDVFYFHNCIEDKLYTDSHLIEFVSTQEIIEKCTSNTSILIVSDAGASRGNKNFERIRKTLQTFFRFKQRTNLITWLNPMPESRWKNSSAGFLAESLQMFQMDSDGFSNAIDTLQGRGIIT